MMINMEQQLLTTAALINALDISKKKIEEVKIVVNGAGASAIACTNLFKKIGVKNENVIMCDRKRSNLQRKGKR